MMKVYKVIKTKKNLSFLNCNHFQNLLNLNFVDVFFKQILKIFEHVFFFKFGTFRVVHLLIGAFLRLFLLCNLNGI